jgi:hypothetical protein
VEVVGVDHTGKKKTKKKNQKKTGTLHFPIDLFIPKVQQQLLDIHQRYFRYFAS